MTNINLKWYLIDNIKKSDLKEKKIEDIPVSNMRKIIAQRLTSSMQQSPHFYLSIDCTWFISCLIYSVQLPHCGLAPQLLYTSEGVLAPLVTAVFIALSDIELHTQIIINSPCNQN